MNEQDRAAYVRAALAVQGYGLDEVRDAARIAAIVNQFERIEGIAASILEVELARELEPAAIFRP